MCSAECEYGGPDEQLMSVTLTVPYPRVHRDRKKIYRVDFFDKASLAGLTNYVIRHNPQNGNMTSHPQALVRRKPTWLAPVQGLYTEGDVIKLWVTVRA